MSSLASCFQVSSEAKYISKEIERQLRDAKREARSQVKLLVLGTAESGKSTFIKQMRIIHGKGYTDEEKLGYVSLIHQNISVSIKMLISAMKKLNIKYGTEENEQIAQVLIDQSREEETNLTREVAQLITILWEDEGVQKCYLRRNEFHLFDSAFYYLNSLDRIASPNFVPTLQDILRTRVPTSGIVEYLFDIDHFIFGIVDVGGQKSERRKWIHCFENVTSIIFLAALSEYDQTIPLEEISQDLRSSIRNLAVSESAQNNNPHKKPLSRTNSEYFKQNKEKNSYGRSTRNPIHRQFSSVHHVHRTSPTTPPLFPSKSYHGLPPFPRTNDSEKVAESPREKRKLQRLPEPEPDLPDINRLEESCALFKTIVENPFFKSTSVILFLNKTDLLEEKIKHSPMSAHFSYYDGPDNDAEAAREFILGLYVKCFTRTKSSKRTLYTHFTCATDTNNIRFVFTAVKDIILQSYLMHYSLV